MCYWWSEVCTKCERSLQTIAYWSLAPPPGGCRHYRGQEIRDCQYPATEWLQKMALFTDVVCYRLKRESTRLWSSNAKKINHDKYNNNSNTEQQQERINNNNNNNNNKNKKTATTNTETRKGEFICRAGSIYRYCAATCREITKQLWQRQRGRVMRAV